MVQHREITKAFTGFESAVKRATTGKSQITDPCALWKSIKGPFGVAVQALSALGTLIPLAKRAAQAMEKVREVMNLLCP